MQSLLPLRHIRSTSEEKRTIKKNTANWIVFFLFYFCPAKRTMFTGVFFTVFCGFMSEWAGFLLPDAFLPFPFFACAFFCTGLLFASAFCLLFCFFFCAVCFTFFLFCGFADFFCFVFPVLSLQVWKTPLPSSGSCSVSKRALSSSAF